ncbi:MAG: alkaline phosphatase family protein, partial [Fidelibacterota bacterium]
CRRELIESSLCMWERLASLKGQYSDSGDKNDPRFFFGVGDQIYSDELWNREGNGAPKRFMRRLAPEERIGAYKEVYQKQLGLSPVSEVTSCCPAFYTWDDHEIRDGWGSHGDEAKYPYMFEAAEEVYFKYQLEHNPLVDRSKGYYSFIYGRIGFVVLDLRRYRNSTTKVLLSDEQFEWLKDWFASEGKECRVVFVVCSVPLVHVSYAISRKANKLIMKHLGLADDLRDQWNSKAYIADTRRFIRLLFDEANERGIRIVVLGGDVHVGTFAALRSSDPKHELHPVIYQFTSSPISNKPTKIARYLDVLAPKFAVGEDLDYSARLLDTFAERNFGLVHIRTKRQAGKRVDYGVTFEIHHEDSDKPVRFPTLW